MSEGNRFPEKFDAERQQELYLREIARDANVLQRDPEFLAWVEQMDAESRAAQDKEAGF